MDQKPGLTLYNTQPVFPKHPYKTKSVSYQDIGPTSTRRSQQSHKIDFDLDHDNTDFNSAFARTRNPTQKSSLGDFRHPDILKKKMSSPMLSTADNFLPSRREKTPSMNPTPEVRIQEQNRMLRAPQSAQSDYPLGDFYLTSKSDNKQFRIKLGRHSSLTSQDFYGVGDVNRLKEKRENLGSPTKSLEGYGLDPNTASKIKLSNFFDTLPPSMREFYADKKEFSKIFDDYNISNYCLDEVTAKVKCYRIELGCLLEKALDTQRKLFEKTLDTAMKLFAHQELIIEKKLQEIRENVQHLELEKQDLEFKNKNFKNLLNISESSSRIQSLNIEKLQSEIKIAYEMNKQEIMQKLNEKQRDEDLLPDQTKERGKKGFTERLQDDIANLQGFFEELDREHINKTRIIKDMNNHLKATLKKIKFDATTQVDEVELAWTAKNIGNFGGDSVKKADLLTIESSTVNVEEKLKEKVDDLEKNPEFEPGDILKIKDKELKAQLESEAVREGKKKQANAGTNPGQGPVTSELENNWNLPLNMIVFLENVTKSGENAKVLPWAYFRKITFEIYNDRVRNRLEIENSLINTFIPFNEYVCLYFLKEYKLRRTAELKLLEFLVSLKYYVKLWPRAQIFASMCNIIGVGKAKDAQEAINVSEYDIYLQNFYLYAYERVFADPSQLVEHSEGTTWIPKQKVEDMVHSVLIFDTELNRKRVWVNLQQQYRVIGEGPDKDNEGLDADRFMLALIDHYVEAKRKNLKAITRFYYKNNQDAEKVLSIEDFASSLAEVNDVEPSVANLVYPKDLTLARAYLYALTSGNNTFAVTFKQFVSGLARFGMDCPFPFISLGGDEQKNKDYYNAGLSSDLFKKKNQQLKKKAGGYQPDKRKMPGMKINEPNKEAEEPAPMKLNAFEHSNPKSFRQQADGNKLAGLKLDSASALFAQQFSVLRELNNYCKQFSEVVEAGDQEFETMMKSFRQIAHILETGCEFLKFPINIY